MLTKLTSTSFGSKLKYVRVFRGLTQRALGVLMGYEEKSADVRIRHYEIGINIPRKPILSMLADVLDVNVINFHVEETGSLEHVMQILFWLDEINPSTFNPIQLEKVPRKKGLMMNPEHDESDLTVKYHDSDYWPANAPMAIWFDSIALNSYVQEWMERKRELQAKLITRDEYFEWKLNWPNTCDDCGKAEPVKKWRKVATGKE